MFNADEILALVDTQIANFHTYAEHIDEIKESIENDHCFGFTRDEMREAVDVIYNQGLSHLVAAREAVLARHNCFFMDVERNVIAKEKAAIKETLDNGGTWTNRENMFSDLTIRSYRDWSANEAHYDELEKSTGRTYRAVQRFCNVAGMTRYRAFSNGTDAMLWKLANGGV